MWSSFQAGQMATTYRPTAVSGAITNSALGYDTDAYPWATSADKATVTGSAVAGVIDTDTVQFDTFASLAKTAFTTCTLQVVYSCTLAAALWQTDDLGLGVSRYHYADSGLLVQYQINGSTWVNLDAICGLTVNGVTSTGTASNDRTVLSTSDFVDVTTKTKQAAVVALPASTFSSNLNNLKIRFVLQTVTNSTDNTKKSSGSYNVWDIRAIVT